jgi:Protein of unknown function (DUF3570)
LYTQTGASFYTSRLAAPQTFMSADYRLAPLDSVLGGLTITRKIDEALSVSLGATFQSQQGRDRILPISTSPPTPGAPAARPISAADMTVTTFSVGLTKHF